jgi:hypothetical protein
MSDNYILIHPELLPPLSDDMLLKAFEKSLLIFVAFIYYSFVGYVKYDIYTYLPFLKKYYMYISLGLHLLFIFVCDLIILYLFVVFFGVRI